MAVRDDGGVKTDAAGRVGFRRPTADPRQYAKLIEHPYQRGWSRLGNFGDHTGAMSRPFVRQVIAPILAGAIEETRDRSPSPASAIVARARLSAAAGARPISPR